MCRARPRVGQGKVETRSRNFNQIHMQNKLYVGGIPYTTTQDELKSAFGQAGAVTSATIITDKMTGRSRGFGFVEMASADEANRAIDLWNGKELGGRTLLVSLARPREERNDRFSR